MAWTRPATGEIVIAHGTNGWSPAHAVEAPGAVATPVVMAVDQGTVVAWRSADGLASASFVASDGSKATRALGAMMPVALAKTGGTVHVIAVVPQLPPIDLLRPLGVVLRPGMGPSGATLDEAGRTGMPLEVTSSVAIEARDVDCGGLARHLLAIRQDPREAWWVELDEHGLAGAVDRVETPGRSGATPALWNRLERIACER